MNEASGIARRFVAFSPNPSLKVAMASEELNESDHARVMLAAQMRRGMHLLIAHDPDTTELVELTAALSQRFDQLERAPQRIRSSNRWESPADIAVPEHGQAFPDSLDRPISGSGNPFSAPMTMYRDGDAVTATVSLEPGFEGAPGRSHGGFVSAIFDDLFGSLPMLHGKIAFTASLTVNYVAPSPIRAPVVYRGWVDRIEGKKIFVVGESHHGDTLVTTATGLFIDATETFLQLYGS